MSSSIQATSRVEIDKNFEDQLRVLRDHAKDESESRRKGEQSQWCMPRLGDWSGDLFDFEGMSQPFDRSAPNEQFVEAITSGDNPGTAGDLITASLQVDYMACMERAFRARHTMRRSRAIAHAMGRKAGHGHDRGTFMRAVLEHLSAINKRAKGGER